MLPPATRKTAAVEKTGVDLATAAHALNVGRAKQSAEISPAFKTRLAAELRKPEHLLHRALHEANAAELKRLDARERELRKGQR